MWSTCAATTPPARPTIIAPSVTSAPRRIHRTFTGSSARRSAERTAERLGGCDRRASRPRDVDGMGEGRSPRSRRSRAEHPGDEAHHGQQRRHREQRARSAAVDEVRVEAVRADRGDEGRREDGQAAPRLLRPRERVAPEAREEHVRREREHGPRDPDRRPSGALRRTKRVLDGGEPERRRRRVDDAVVRLVEVLREERGPRRGDLGRLLDGRDDEEQKDERAGLARRRDAHVEPRARRGALGDEERARGGDGAEGEGHADEPAAARVAGRSGARAPRSKGPAEMAGEHPAQRREHAVRLVSEVDAEVRREHAAEADARAREAVELLLLGREHRDVGLRDARRQRQRAGA